MLTDATIAPPKSSGILRSLYQLASPPAFDPRPAHVEGVRYGDRRGAGVAPLADVYLPDGRGPHASVLLIHGGGFVIGSRRMKPVRYLATRLCEAGIAAAAIDYRLIFRGGRLAEALADVDAAARWWRATSASYGIDPDRIAVAGLSAGATLAVLAAAAAPERFHRIVSFFGVYDFAVLNGRLASSMRRLLLQSRDREVWARHSPLARATMPTPLLLLHGTADTLVPIEHARRLHARRSELGLPVELIEYPGIPHGFLNDATLPESRAAADAVIRFLEA
ncbi:Monoacylglycerol lipase [Myxococcaceae bacterium]|jgi:acetyl esterase/lipase|nr:Monoacylglycerol lipase [Myxococcaceae bacterium]